jgi:hypothetical protein
LRKASTTGWVSRFRKSRFACIKLTTALRRPENAIPTAVARANKTLRRWNRPANGAYPSEGVYYHLTYKAICRRHGVFTNAKGLHDWNAQLAEPILKAVSSGWERTFARQIPMIFHAEGSQAAISIKLFHDSVDAGAGAHGGSAERIQTLSQQLGNYQGLLRDLFHAQARTIVAQRKEISRKFQPTIAEELHSAYSGCNDENGKNPEMSIYRVHLLTLRLRPRKFHENENLNG